MNDNVDDIKKELDEVRRLKEELRQEVDEVRREKAETIRRKEERSRREKERTRRRSRPPRPPRRVKPVRPLRDVDIDLSAITDSLEDMMEGLGKSIEMSIKEVEGMPKSIRFPGVRIHKTDRKGRKTRKSDIEKIPPERVAKIVAPLGSEERLKILEFLKKGGQTFNEIEIYTEKTGSSLTHHLNPLVDAGYVMKGEVRGTYYLTVEGRLAYRLAQWLTHRVERQRDKKGKNGSDSKTDVAIDFEEDDDEDDETVVIVEDEENLEKAADNLERVQDEVAQLEEQEDEAEDLDSLDWED